MAAGATRGRLAPRPPRGSSCVKGLASYIPGDKGRWAISTSCLSQSIPPGGDHVLPMGTPWVSAWLPAICRSPSSGTPLVPFPGKWNRGSREALSVPLPLCSQPPRPREVQAAALRRGRRDGASPLPPISQPAPVLSLPLPPPPPPTAPGALLLSPQGPCPSSLETGLIWDCYKNNNNPNAEKPRKGLRAALPPHPLPPHSKPSTKPHPKQTFCTGVGAGEQAGGWPGVALYKSELVTAPEVPVGPLQGRRVSGHPR